MKGFLILEVRKSDLKKLAFIKSDFLNLADFAIVNKFSIFLPILPLITLPITSDAF